MNELLTLVPRIALCKLFSGMLMTRLQSALFLRQKGYIALGSEMSKHSLLRAMRLHATSLSLLALLVGCAGRPSRDRPANSAVPPRLDSYFEDYCDYTGSLGIGFVPSHTWAYRFRHHLKTTKDPELKRLFVLQHLYPDVEAALHDFGAGMVRTGKSSSRPLTLEEWRRAQQDIRTKIDDLAAYSSFTNFASSSFDPMDPPDPSLDGTWIEELKERLQGITNAPAGNESLHSTPR